ncbi:MAG: carboxypeptidase regulatory-like domain-containing protein [Flavobacteriales bacterium]|jgi:3-oxoacyl-[acyl-carrier-protein] synthase III|nr:carboxypeptidase regulatory-like domain-containing protein [Flavobacteriales bacterium]
MDVMSPMAALRGMYRCLLVVGLLVLSQAIHAQSGSLRGRIKAKGEEALTGARVVLSDSLEAVLAETQSGSGGNYEFAEVAPGQYCLTVENTGYETRRLNAVEVKPKTITFVDFRLTPTDEPAKRESVCKWRRK